MSRVLVHALTAAGLSAMLLLILVSVLQLPVASWLYVVAAPGVSALVAVHYFWRRDAQDPLTTAIVFTVVAAVVNLVVASLARGRIELLDPAFGFGLPLMLLFGATGLTGEILPVLRGDKSA